MIDSIFHVKDFCDLDVLFVSFIETNFYPYVRVIVCVISMKSGIIACHGHATNAKTNAKVV